GRGHGEAGMTPPPGRGVVTEKQLISSDADGAIQRAGRFRVENGSSDEDLLKKVSVLCQLWLGRPQLGDVRGVTVHQNYVGTDAEKNPFYLSVVLSDQNNQRVPHAMNLDKFERGPREILNPEIQKDLLVLEEQEGSVNFKFGVLYAKDGQLTDDEMFSNEEEVLLSFYMNREGACMEAQALWLPPQVLLKHLVSASASGTHNGSGKTFLLCLWSCGPCLLFYCRCSPSVIGLDPMWGWVPVALYPAARIG
ncbi:hypothetical protein NHX12_028027, partial [Muraenolepis orangiensis]